MFAPLAPVQARLQRAVKAAFDPAGRFNPGKLVSNDKRTLIPINTVHLPQRGAVVADRKSVV